MGQQLLGRIACLPSYHPYTSWTHAHCSLHHAWTCFKGKHPDFAPMSKAEYDALPAWRRLVERLYRSPIGPPFSIIFSFWLRLCFGRPEIVDRPGSGSFVLINSWSRLS